MKKGGLLLVVVLLAAALINGCAVFGRTKDFKPFDQQLLNQVVPGKTTAQEVTKLFGAPNQVIKLSNGNAYLYNRNISKSAGLWLVVVTFVNMDTQHDRLVFFLNNNDIVTNFGRSLDAADAAYGMPF